MPHYLMLHPKIKLKGRTRTTARQKSLKAEVGKPPHSLKVRSMLVELLKSSQDQMCGNRSFIHEVECAVISKETAQGGRDKNPLYSIKCEGAER